MFEYRQIIDVMGREILDCDGNPAIEVEMLIEDGSVGTASVSLSEMHILPDTQGRPESFCAQEAVYDINTRLADAIIGENVLHQNHIDRILLRTGCEGCRIESEDRWKIKRNTAGSAALLAVSAAAARSAAACLGMSVNRYLGGIRTCSLPALVAVMLKKEDLKTDPMGLEGISVVFKRQRSYRENMILCREIYRKLQEKLWKKENEGAGLDVFACMELLHQSVLDAGAIPGKDLEYGLHAGGERSYDSQKGVYRFPQKSGEREELEKNGEDLAGFYKRIADQYPVAVIEEGLAREDARGWKAMKELEKTGIALWSEEVFQDSPRGEDHGTEPEANTLVIKPYAGTITGLIRLCGLARRHHCRIALSGRENQGMDTLAADLALAVGADWIVLEPPCHMEYISSYNQLLRSEDLF